MSHTRMTTLSFLLLELSPFALFLKLIVCRLCNSNTLRNILMIVGINVEQDEMTCPVQEWQKKTTLAFLLLVLSPFVIFDSDYALILCLLCKSNTLWNIFMILGRNVEQD